MLLKISGWLGSYYAILGFWIKNCKFCIICTSSYYWVYFSMQFFSGNCSYQEALSRTSPAAVNILSSSSGYHWLPYIIIVILVLPCFRKFEDTILKLLLLFILIDIHIHILSVEFEDKSSVDHYFCCYLQGYLHSY